MYRLRIRPQPNPLLALGLTEDRIPEVDDAVREVWVCGGLEPGEDVVFEDEPVFDPAFGSLGFFVEGAGFEDLVLWG